jgi:hypothetical protein
MVTTSKYEHVETVSIESEVVAAELRDEVGRAGAVLRVMPFVHALAVVQEREQLDDVLTSAVQFSNCEAVDAYARPMRHTVRTSPVEAESCAQASDEEPAAFRGERCFH